MADTRERSLSIVTSLTEPRSACNTWNINTIEKTSQLNILTGVSNMKWENTFLILGIYFAFYLPEPHELWQLQAPSLHHRSCQPEFTLPPSPNWIKDNAIPGSEQMSNKPDKDWEWELGDFAATLSPTFVLHSVCKPTAPWMFVFRYHMSIIQGFTS